MIPSVEVIGADEFFKQMDALPKEVKKASDKALREGGKAAVQVIRAQGPERWRSLVRQRLHTDAVKNSYVMAGYQSTGKQQTEGIPDWFKAYWSNYGTLSHRSPSHRFKRKIRARVQGRRNNTGQPAQNFFEIAARGSDQAFIRAYKEFLKTKI